MKPSFAIVGCGKVGSALARFLTAAGYRAAGLASKSCHRPKGFGYVGNQAYSAGQLGGDEIGGYRFHHQHGRRDRRGSRQIAGHNACGKSHRSSLRGSLSSEILFPAKECGASI